MDALIRFTDEQVDLMEYLTVLIADIAGCDRVCGCGFTVVPPPEGLVGVFHPEA